MEIVLCELKITGIADYVTKKHMCRRTMLCCKFCDLRENCEAYIFCENDPERCGLAYDKSKEIKLWETKQIRMGELTEEQREAPEIYCSEGEVYKMVKSYSGERYRVIRKENGTNDWKTIGGVNWRQTKNAAMNEFVRYTQRKNIELRKIGNET